MKLFLVVSAGGSLTPSPATLEATLDRLTRPAQLVQELDRDRVRCLACGHRCLIPQGRRGICKVRHNRKGTLRAPYGYVAGLHNDPIEKKPFYHLLPGARALTLGMLGCSFHCPYCQNWLTSQALRDERAGSTIETMTASRVVDLARKQHARVVVSSYNEPLITAEWAGEIFAQAQAAGLKTAVVSNGNATPEVLAFLRPHTDGFKVDLKSMHDRTYRRLGGVLQRVLDTIQQAYDLGFWVEIVTLVVPGLNDSERELQEAADFIAGVSPQIPWHVTAFHPDYQLTTTPRTSLQQLRRAVDAGRRAGLKFVYGGNLSMSVPELEHTFCPGCELPLIRRTGYQRPTIHLTPDGACPDCGTAIPGVWA